MPEFTRGDLVLHECRPKHFRLRDTTWTFLCRVSVGGPDGERRDVWLEGSVGAPGTRQPVLDGRVAAFGSDAWRCLLPALGVELRTAPADTAVPLVSQLEDAELARVLLERAIQDGTPACADLRIAACRPRVMRYDRGSRCTVRYQLTHPGAAVRRGWPEVVVAKTYRDDTGQNAYQGMRALWSSELSRSSAVAIAEPLAYVPGLRLLVQGPVAEDRTLERLICSSLPAGPSVALEELHDYLAKAAQGLAALHGCGVALGETVTLEGEVAQIEAVLEHLAGVVPELSGAAAPLLARVVALAAEHRADPVRPSHGSFRPAQVLLHRGRVGFIDFDAFCQAEPAHDVARFRAGIRDCVMRAHLAAGGGFTDAAVTAIEDVCDEFLRHYAAVAPVSRRRVMLWETLDLITYVVHAWTRTSPARLVARMLTLEQQVRRSGLMDAGRQSADPHRIADRPRAA
ncbi:MAG TPA: phosphotransferase [Candidatus Dormibacteraeota bacterium]